jgi:hypothetical protein
MWRHHSAATQGKLDQRKVKQDINAAKEELAALRRADREEELRAEEAADEANRVAQNHAMQVRTRNCILCTCLALQRHLQF